MIGLAGQLELDPFAAGNNILREPLGVKPKVSFDEMLEKEIKEFAEKTKEKITDAATKDTKIKKKERKEDLQLPDITKITANEDKNLSREVKNTYSLLDKFKEDKNSNGDFLNDPRQQALNNANNAASQQFVQPIYDQGEKRRYTKADVLSRWEKFTPQVSEDITKRSIRIDIPLLNDVQALVLRMHPDRSISATLLGSKAMEDVIKQNKDKLDRKLRHHQLSLREFNTFVNEPAFNSETGTKKKRKQNSSSAKASLDLV